MGARQLAMVGLLGTLVMAVVVPGRAGATPEAPGYVPEQVGNFEAARRSCDASNTPLPEWLLDLILWLAQKDCDGALDRVDDAFTAAYRLSEGEGASPGYPTNDAHWWQSVLIQDFTSGHWGKGAIMMKGSKPTAPPEYVGGGAWSAFVRAANNYGVFPGYPINREHDWNRVRIQDFQEGSWGDGAIIGGANAELVAGNHWQAYVRANGSVRLRTPRTFVAHRSGEFVVDVAGGGQRVTGWFWVQEFDGGQIWERGGVAYVWFYDSGTWHQVL